MISARKSNVLNPRWYQASVLLSAVAVLPLGFAAAQDFEAVEHRLAEGVLEGELTLQQAAIMIDVLKGNQANRAREKQRWSRGRQEHHEIKDHLRMVGERLKAAVKAGKMTEEEARAKWEAMEKEWAAKECAEQECARKSGLEDHYRRMGISDEAFDRIERYLHENGIQREQLDMVMGAMLRVIHQMKSKGDDFELDPRLRDYFTGELGLTDQQVELVQGMARRVAHRMRDSNEQPGEENRDENRDAERSAREDARPYWDGIRQRIEGAVERGDLTREEADARYREIRERMGRERGNASDRRDDNSKRAGRAVREGIRQRIEGAVERGDLTREEADARYRKFRERVAGEGEAAQRDSGNREKE